MSAINVYAEGERLAELAVRERVGRKQLDMLATYAETHPPEATRLWIRKQVARGFFSVNFAKELEALLEKTTGLTFSRILRIAYDCYTWKEYEPTAETLYQHLKALEKVVQGYADRFRLGKASVSIRVVEGRVRLEIAFERPVSDFERGRVARALMDGFRSQVPEVARLNFQPWIIT